MRTVSRSVSVVAVVSLFIITACASSGVREASDPAFRAVPVDTTSATSGVAWNGTIDGKTFSLTREITETPERRAIPGDAGKKKAKEKRSRITLRMAELAVSANAENNTAMIYEIIKGATVLDKEDHEMKGDIIGIIKAPVRFTFSRIDNGVSGSISMAGSTLSITSTLNKKNKSSWKSDFNGAYAIKGADGTVLATVQPASGAGALAAEFFESESSRAYSTLYLRKTLDEPTVKLVSALALLTLSLGR